MKLETYHSQAVLNQCFRISLATCTYLRAYIDEIHALVVTLLQDLFLSPMQQGQELTIEAYFALAGKPEVESPESRTENGEPVIHVFTRWHPSCVSLRV